MLRNRLIGITAAVVFSLALTSAPAFAQGKGVITKKEVSLDLALKMAQAAIAKCRSEGYHVSVHVMDTSGLDKVALRDDGSGSVNFSVSRRKANTALTYQRPSSDMEKAWAHMSPDRIIPSVIGVGGGLPIKVGNEIIGAIGVGGAPGSDKDEACAAAGLAAGASELK